MARFDLYRPRSGAGHLLDIQSSALESLPFRMVVPLLPPSAVLPVIRGVTPVFRVGDQEVAMMTHHLAAIPKREPGPPVGNLVTEQDETTRALDVLTKGF